MSGSANQRVFVRKTYLKRSTRVPFRVRFHPAMGHGCRKVLACMCPACGLVKGAGAHTGEEWFHGAVGAEAPAVGDAFGSL